MDQDQATETAPPPEASAETKALNAAIDAEPGANSETPPEGGDKQEAPPKKEKTPEEREISRLRRRVDSLTKRLYQRSGESSSLPASGDGDTTPPSQGDEETLQLSKRELQKLVEAEAKKLAPQLKQQDAEIERRRSVVNKLAKDWGQEKFNAYASDLDDAFGGLADDSGRAKPATDAIFEADDPRALIEYLSDPDHSDEAEALGRMNAVQAGRAIGKLEAKLASKKEQPKPSNTPDPIPSLRGQGNAPRSLLDLEGADFDKRRRQQIANRR